MRVFDLVNRRGSSARLTDYGAIVMALRVPDRRGRFDDVVLGFEQPETYAAGNPYFGCTAGRCANRVAGARFTLDGREYRLDVNDGVHHLHGGARGFDKKTWSAEPGETAEGPFVRFELESPDGDQGYPGALRAEVRYTLTHGDEFRVEMSAVTDRPTLCNLVHHGYWNLGGHASGDVLAHELRLASSRYTPADATLIPTGELAPVEGTAFDFRSPKPLGRDIARAGLPGPGYDHNFAVDGADGSLRPVAVLHDPRSGRTMELLSGEPGVQVYTGNFLDGTLAGKGGVRYPRHAGICLETQKFPDAIHRPDWVQPVLRPGERYRHVMVHRFRGDSFP